MGPKGEQWARKVEERFNYLADFGFARLSVSDDSFWEIRVTFKSDVSAMAVIRSVEFDRVEVELMRLVNGALPEYPIFVVDSVAVNTFYLDDLVALRSPDWPVGAGGLSEASVDRQLAEWAIALRQHGADFLAGDLSVLDQLEAIVRARAAGSPQQVQVWMPEGTSISEADATAEQVRKTVPDGVSVLKRWYRRRRQP